ncbi:MAG: DUF421 domain-containing protein [Christensenellales bacterium]|jgi:uncharacterized membrane protein YcaP (DUF421 family)
MLTLFLRAMILYIVMIIVMRGLGRRQLGQFQPYEFAMTILLADVIATPMGSVSTPLMQGLLPVAGMFIVHSAITLIGLKSDKARAFFSGKPAVVISKGIVNEKELERLCISLADLLEGLRGSGVLDPYEVGTAVIEANGTISAFPHSSNRAPSTAELGIDPGYEGLPMILVMDGRVQENNLAQCERDEPWLKEQLARVGLTIAETYFAYIDTQGMFTAQRKGGGLERIEAFSPAEVRW